MPTIRTFNDKNLYENEKAFLSTIHGHRPRDRWRVLLFTAFFMPPAAVIDPSVLTAYGETLTFAGALIGLDYKYRASNSNPDDPCAR